MSMALAYVGRKGPLMRLPKQASSEYRSIIPSRAWDIRRGSDMVKHGPQDCWPERNNSNVAKSNKGPQVGNGKSITAYIPDPDSPGGVKVLKIDNPTDFKALYVALGIDWNAAYGINALKNFCL